MYPPQTLGNRVWADLSEIRARSRTKDAGQLCTYGDRASGAGPADAHRRDRPGAGSTSMAARGAVSRCPPRTPLRIGTRV